MNQYVTGAVIKELREKYHLTQAQLAEKLNVSDKTVSKWETAKGYPDISLLEPIAKFYVCPVCGNSIHSMGEAVIQCHGIILKPCQAEETDENHKIFIERVEDEYYVSIEHDMTKQHYISFVAALSSDKLQMIKLYPEGNAEARVKINGVRRILFYCNRDGLFSITPVKGIDDKQTSYDDAEERKELERAAKVLFG